MPQISGRGLILPNDYFKPGPRGFDGQMQDYINSGTVIAKYIVLEPKLSARTADQYNPSDYFSDRLIKSLANGSISIIFDCSLEGARLSYPYYERFRDDFVRNSFPLDNFYYLTCDANERSYYNNVDNIYHINLVDTLVTPPTTVVERQKDHLFSCLNRKPRYWRSRMIFELCKKHQNHMLCSHPKINSVGDFNNSTGVPVIEQDMVDFLIKNTPMQASTSNPLTDGMLNDNYMDALPEVYSRVCFDLAMETDHDPGYETLSEKTFKPMMNMLPVIIWGVPGINTTALTRLGFRTYEDWFDLSFDSEPNTEKRMKLLIAEIDRVCAELCSASDLTAWQNKNVQVLEHNRTTLLNGLSTNIFELSRLYKNLENLTYK